MFKLLLSLLLSLPIFLQAQDFQMKLHAKNLPKEAQPLLLRLYNGNLFVLDSLPVRVNDTLIFRIPRETKSGMLKAILGSTPLDQFMKKPPVSIDVIFNQEDIEIATDFLQPEILPEIIRSQENRIYFDFLQKDALFFRKLGLLEQVLIGYPDQDDFYQKAREYYKKTQQQRDQFIDRICRSHQHSLASRIIKNQKLPITETSTSSEVRDSILLHYYLTKVDFSDTTLLYTNVYTDKIFKYIQMFMKRNATPRENEANCIRALDRLVPLLSANTFVQQQLMQFLIDGFENMKMEEVLAHISANYLQQCGSSSEIVKRRLEGYHKMAIGQQVPDFTIPDIQGKAVNLYNTLHPYTLLLFWHTGCSHCQQLMQELLILEKQQFFKNNQIKIIGVSVDESREDWEKFSGNYRLEWINTHEAGFESQLANDYNLFATPTMFLLNENYKIIAKPMTSRELQDSIEKL